MDVALARAGSRPSRRVAGQPLPDTLFDRMYADATDPWNPAARPPGPFDLVVLSEVCYYLQPDVLRAALDREIPRLARGATVVAAHWRRPVDDHPMMGDHANDVIAATAGLHLIGSYRDADVAIEVFDTATDASVAARDGIPGARR